MLNVTTETVILFEMLYLCTTDSIMNFYIVLGLILVTLSIAVVGIAIRLFLVKDGEVRGGCAGKNPMMQEEGVACTVCGAMPTEECKSEE